LRATTAAVCALALASAAQAQDFFSALFGGFGGGRSRPPAMSLPFPGEGGPFPQNDVGILRSHQRRTLFSNHRP
jgi:hypothetical protein